jgi:hypothetical protein
LPTLTAAAPPLFGFDVLGAVPLSTSTVARLPFGPELALSTFTAAKPPLLRDPALPLLPL